MTDDKLHFPNGNSFDQLKDGVTTHTNKLRHKLKPDGRSRRGEMPAQLSAPLNWIPAKRAEVDVEEESCSQG